MPWSLSCPKCGFCGDDQQDFTNVKDGCFCPKCNERIEFEFPEDDDDDFPIGDDDDGSGF